MKYSEEHFIALSALQHFVFCPRQCALIHIERQWEENALTARGRIEHDRVHAGYKEFRHGKRHFTGLHVFSKALGLYGQIDVLEFDLADENGPDNMRQFKLKGTWNVRPVEFKHGQSKKSDCDRIQVCAQALCLEEILNVSIQEAALFYHRIKRREVVQIDDELRDKTVSCSNRLHRFIQKGDTPPPVNDRRCRSCSLNSICMPGKMNKRNAYRQILFHPQDLT